jgi:hypothetical protein
MKATVSESILDFEELVPTRETCARLTDAGFPPRTYFCWHVNIRDEWQIFCNGFDSVKPGPIPAPTAAELGQVLPLNMRHEGVEYFLKLSLTRPVYASGDGRKTFGVRPADTEAEARALLWLRLESEGLLSEDNTA